MLRRISTRFLSATLGHIPRSEGRTSGAAVCGACAEVGVQDSGTTEVVSTGKANRREQKNRRVAFKRGQGQARPGGPPPNS